MGHTTVIPPVVGLAVLALVFMGALVDAHADKEEGNNATRNLSVEESGQWNFLTVIVPLRADKTARMRIFSGDQLHEKVYDLAKYYDLSLDEMQIVYADLHHSLVKWKAIPVTVVPVNEAGAPSSLRIFSGDVLEAKVDAFCQEHELSQDASDRLLESAGAALMAASTPELPPPPSWFYASKDAAKNQAIALTPPSDGSRSESDASEAGHVNTSNASQPLLVQLRDASAPGVGNESATSLLSYEFIISVWDQPQRLRLYSNQDLQAAVHSFADLHKIPEEDRSLLVSNVRRLVESKQATQASSTSSSSSLSDELEVLETSGQMVDAPALDSSKHQHHVEAHMDNGASVFWMTVYVQGQPLVLEVRAREALGDAVDRFVRQHSLGQGVRPALLAAVSEQIPTNSVQVQQVPVDPVPDSIDFTVQVDVDGKPEELAVGTGESVERAVDRFTRAHNIPDNLKLGLVDSVHRLRQGSGVE